jgi:hypothetical protein
MSGSERLQRFVHLVECGGGDRLHSGILDLPSASRLRDQEHSCCRNRKGLSAIRTCTDSNLDGRMPVRSLLVVNYCGPGFTNRQRGWRYSMSDDAKIRIELERIERTTYLVTDQQSKSELEAYSDDLRRSLAVAQKSMWAFKFVI